MLDERVRARHVRPQFGGLLLGGIVAAHVGEIDLDLVDELERLLRDLEAGEDFRASVLRCYKTMVLLFEPPWLASAPTGSAILAIFGLATVSTALAYILYFRSLAALGGVVTSQVGYIVTLAGLLWGFLLFGEVPGWLTAPAAARMSAP